MKKESNINSCLDSPQNILKNHERYKKHEVELAMLALCDLVETRDEQIMRANKHIEDLDDVISWNRYEVKRLKETILEL